MVVRRWSLVHSSEQLIFLTCWAHQGLLRSLWIFSITFCDFLSTKVAYMFMVIFVCARAFWCNWMCSGLPNCILASVNDTTFHIHFLGFVNVPWWFYARVAVSEHPLFLWVPKALPEGFLVNLRNTWYWEHAVVIMIMHWCSWAHSGCPA